MKFRTSVCLNLPIIDGSLSLIGQEVEIKSPKIINLVSTEYIWFLKGTVVMHSLNFVCVLIRFAVVYTVSLLF